MKTKPEARLPARSNMSIKVLASQRESIIDNCNELRNNTDYRTRGDIIAHAVEILLSASRM